MPRKHHSKKRQHRRSQRGGDWFGSSSTPSSSGSDSGWFSGITNKAKGLTSSISSWFGSSSPSTVSSAPNYQSQPSQPQYGQPQGQYAGRRRHTRKLGRHGKSKRRR